jgi:uncharacterized protein
MKYRNLATVLSQRISESKPLIQVVIGPRQIGKTTALKAVFKHQGLYRSADSPVPTAAQEIEKWWKEAEKLDAPLLAIDEIQKVANWPETIKWLWDKSENFKLVLTGSSSLLVEKGLKESLAGRFELIKGEHWNYREARNVFGFSVNDFINYGCYPGSVDLLPDLNRWSQFIQDAIVEPVIGRDLLQLHPIDNPALLRQVFGLASAHPAQIISLQKMQGQLQSKGAVATVQNYLDLLAHAFIVTPLQKYSAQAIRVRKSSPKLIIHDNALVKAFERPVTEELSPERKGRYFENAVIARFIEAGWETYYWKHRDLEVDAVVISPENEHLAVEIKTSPTSPAELKGLTAFCRQHPAFTPCLLSLANQQIQGVRALDVEAILSLCRQY